MRTATTLISILSLTGGVTAFAAAPAVAGGAPVGSGANGCYLVLPASYQQDGSGTSQTLKINVGNPASVTLAGSCDGAPLSVDDILGITAAHPNGAGGTVSKNFVVGWCAYDDTVGPIDVTSAFATGTHSVTVGTANSPVCGGPTRNPDVYLIVKQRG